VRAKGDTVTAPLSGRQAVAFSSTARLYEGDGHYRRVVDQFHDQHMVDFVLETKDGFVEVEAAHAELEYAPEPLIPRKIEREQAFLTRAGCKRSARDDGFDEIVDRAWDEGQRARRRAHRGGAGGGLSRDREADRAVGTPGAPADDRTAYLT
jgi:hypothetical protein